MRRRKSVPGRWVGIGVSEKHVQRSCGRRQLRGPLELMVGVRRKVTGDLEAN